MSNTDEYFKIFLSNDEKRRHVYIVSNIRRPHTKIRVLTELQNKKWNNPDTEKQPTHTYYLNSYNTINKLSRFIIKAIFPCVWYIIILYTWFNVCRTFIIFRYIYAFVRYCYLQYDGLLRARFTLLSYIFTHQCVIVRVNRL